MSPSMTSSMYSNLLPTPTRRSFLQFHGVDSAFYCWLNGTLVGFSKDSRLPAEFDITRLIRPGTNLLAVQVWVGREGGGSLVPAGLSTRPPRPAVPNTNLLFRWLRGVERGSLLLNLTLTRWLLQCSHPHAPNHSPLFFLCAGHRCNLPKRSAAPFHPITASSHCRSCAGQTQPTLRTKTCGGLAVFTGRGGGRGGGDEAEGGGGGGGGDEADGGGGGGEAEGLASTGRGYERARGAS